MDAYVLDELIGEGSFGKVYKARIKSSGYVVAMKLIAKKGKNDRELRNLRREIEILTKLNHEHIITLFDWFETVHEFVVVMEYAQGDLFEILEADKHLPEAVVQRIAKQLIQALYYLHNNRIIHRDMKPQNILIAQNSTVKLADFGFARAMSYNTMVLTSIKGTPLYMAPELIQEQPYDSAADLWSLGCILFELYYGRPPFYSNNLYTLTNKIINDTVKFEEPISPDFRSFLQGLLTKSSTARLNWPHLLEHPFVVINSKDADWMEKAAKHDLQMKHRLQELECCFNAVSAPRLRQSIRLSQSVTTLLSVSSQNIPDFDDVMNVLTNENEAARIQILDRLISIAEKSVTEVTKLALFEKILHQSMMEPLLKLIDFSKSVPLTQHALHLLCAIVFPNNGKVFPFPSSSLCRGNNDEHDDNFAHRGDVCDDGGKNNPAKRRELSSANKDSSCNSGVNEEKDHIDLPVRQHVAMALMTKPHTALLHIMDEVISNRHDERETCLKVLYQCVRWKNEFGPMFTQLDRFGELWQVVLEMVAPPPNRRGSISALALSSKTPHLDIQANNLNSIDVYGNNNSNENNEYCGIGNYYDRTNSHSTDIHGRHSDDADNDDTVLQSNVTPHVAAFVLHVIATLTPHIKLAASKHFKADILQRICSLALDYVRSYCTPIAGRLRDEASVAKLNLASASVSLAACVHRELGHASEIEVDLRLIDGLHAIANTIKQLDSFPVEPGVLGTSFGYLESGLLDGIMHICFLIFSNAEWYGACGKSMKSISHVSLLKLALPRYKRNEFFSFAVSLMLEDCYMMELSPIGVQMGLRLLQQHFRRQREVSPSVDFLLDPMFRRGGEPVCLLSVVCLYLRSDYLRKLASWPESRNGDIIGVSNHVTIMAQIFSEILKMMEARSPSSSESRVNELQQLMHDEALVELFILALDYTDIAFWSPIFSVLHRLTNLSMYFVKSFVECGGLQGGRIARALNTQKANILLIIDALNILSQIARSSKSYYPSIDEAKLYNTFFALIRQPEKEIRSKMCTLIGNLCKHSAYFYEYLAQYKLVEGVVQCCKDKDPYTQKFAAFAVGNAAFYNDCLYEYLRPTIPTIIELLSSKDDKTRQNAAAALSNFVRNGDRLMEDILHYRAPSVLLDLLRSDSPTIRNVILITLNTFCTYKKLRVELISLGIEDMIEKLTRDPAVCTDPIVLKYTGRIRKNIGI